MLPTVPLPWFQRWTSAALRAVGLLPSGKADFSQGFEFGSEMATAPGFAPLRSMSAFAAFPWVYACANAIATDMSGLPMIAIKGEGESAERLDSHPALDLIRRPSSRVSGVLLRRQTMLYHIMGGDGYQRIIGENEPLALIGIHPQDVDKRPWTDGQIGSFLLTPTSENVPYEEILNFALPSWEADARRLFGTGIIRPLSADLTTDLAAKQSSARTAQTGQVTGVMSPRSDDDQWTEEQVKKLRRKYEDRFFQNSGIMFLGQGAKFEKFGFSPKDMEYSEQAERTREAVLAAFDVPPARVGLPNTNYATANAQLRQYWMSLQGRAALLDAEYTRLAAMFGDADVRIMHDFTGVEVLQESRTERQTRVKGWVDLGIPLADALTAEGFEDVDASGAAEEEPPTPAVVEEPERTAGLRALMFPVEPRAEDDDDDEPWRMPDGDEARGNEWRGFAETLHGPTERGLQAVLRKYLKDQAERVARRVRVVLGEDRMTADGLVVTRQISDVELAAIVAEAEEAILLEQATRGTIQSALKRAFSRAVAQMGAGAFDFDPVRLDRAVEGVLGDLIVNVGTTTKAAVRELVSTGIVAGDSIAAMQSELITSQAFSAHRALRIARTETTRSVNAGAEQAYMAALSEGVNVRKQWLTSRDDVVRDEHVALDGDITDVDREFTDDSGNTARHPGGFGVASLDINCRCTILPVVIS